MDLHRSFIVIIIALVIATNTTAMVCHRSSSVEPINGLTPGRIFQKDEDSVVGSSDPIGTIKNIGTYPNCNFKFAITGGSCSAFNANLDGISNDWIVVGSYADCSANNIPNGWRCSYKKVANNDGVARLYVAVTTYSNDVCR